jgi:Family of unknown function (DUF6263)
MKKILIVSALISGLSGNLSVLLAQAVKAEAQPTKLSATEASPALRLKLITRGAEPNRKIEFRPIINTKQTSIMIIDTSMSGLSDGNDTSMSPLPKIAMKIESNVEKIDPSGDVHYLSTYTEIKVVATKNTSAAMESHMKKSLQGMIGTKESVVMGKNGQVKSKKIIFPQGQNPTTQVEDLVKVYDKIMRSTKTFPSETIGIGAKWQVNDVIDVGGVNINQASTYEVIKIDDRGMTIKSKLTQSIPPKDLPSFTNRDGSTGKMLSYSSTGENVSVIRFNSLLPVSSRLSLDHNNKTSFQIGLTSRATSFRMKTVITMAEP